MSDTQGQREASQAETEQAREFGAVFWVTIIISAAFVLWGTLSTDTFSSALTAIVGWITSSLGWVYMLIRDRLNKSVGYACSTTGRKSPLSPVSRAGGESAYVAFF